MGPAAAILIPVLKTAATLALPMIMEKVAGHIVDKGTTRRVNHYKKGPNAGKVSSVTVKKTLGAKTATPFKYLGNLLTTGAGIALPAALHGIATASSAAGRAAGSAANAVANAPKAFLAGTATPQQQAIYGKSILEPFANVVSLAGEPANIALSGAGDAVANTVGDIGKGFSNLAQRRLLEQDLESQYEKMKDSGMSAAQLGYMGRALTGSYRLTDMLNSGKGAVIENPPSDERVKDFNQEDNSFNSDKVRYILEKIGKLKEFNEEETVDDEVLSKYADYIHNYLYTYNEEALKVDPATDTEQEHIGPMAQDLQQVNPATVKEDPKSGYLTVDTGRLALMNAGAIAELARKLEALENEHSS